MAVGDEPERPFGKGLLAFIILVPATFLVLLAIFLVPAIFPFPIGFGNYREKEYGSLEVIVVNGRPSPVEMSEVYLNDAPADDQGCYNTTPLAGLSDKVVLKDGESWTFWCERIEAGKHTLRAVVTLEGETWTIAESTIVQPSDRATLHILL